MLQLRQRDLLAAAPVSAPWGAALPLESPPPQRDVRAPPALRLAPQPAPKPALESDAELRSWFVAEVLPLEQMLLRFLRRNWRNASEIEDLKQDAYARLWEAAHRGRPARAKAFLFLVVRNLMIDRLRQKRLVCIDCVADPDQLDVSDGAPTPERQVAAREELKLLQACMDDLSPRTRQILMLRKVEGYAQREVATLLGVTEETVEHQVSRGIRQVKGAFARSKRRR